MIRYININSLENIWGPSVAVFISAVKFRQYLHVQSWSQSMVASSWMMTTVYCMNSGSGKTERGNNLSHSIHGNGIQLPQKHTKTN